MNLKLILVSIGIFKSMLSFSTEEEWKKHYEQIKNSHFDLKTKTDSAFLLIYGVSRQNILLSVTLAKDFFNFSKSQKKIYGKAYLALGYSYYTSGAMKESSRYCELSLEKFENEKDTIALCFTLQVLSTIYMRTSSYDLAIKTNEKALLLAKKINNNTLISNTLNSFGVLMTFKKNYPLAKKYHFEALQKRKQSKNLVDIQASYTNIGIACKNLLQYDSAFFYHHKAMAIAQKMKSDYAIAYTSSDLGNLHLLLNNTDSSEIYLLEAVKIRQRIGEEWELGYTYNFLGELYRKKNQYKKSISALQEAVKLGKKTGNSKQVYEAYEQLSLTYSQMKNFENAFEYYQQMTLLKDSVYASNNNLSAEMLISNYESEKKQQEIQILNDKSKLQKLYIDRQNNWLWIVGLTTLLLLCFIILFVRNRQLYLLKVRLKHQQHEEKIKKEGENKLTEYRDLVSMELHDSVGANLTFVKELVENLELSNKKEDLQKITEETIQELRKSVWLLNQTEVQFEDWVIRLKEYFHFLKQVHVIETVASNDNPIINSTIVKELFRVCQEAVNNALKHSGGSLVKIYNSTQNNFISVIIEDNGKGIEQDQKEGFGLMNIKQRIHKLNGTIDFTNTEIGTRITIHVPLTS